MRRYTINYKFDETYLPMINCDNMEVVAQHILNDEEDSAFKVFDHVKQEWVNPNCVLLACVLSKQIQNMNN